MTNKLPAKHQVVRQALTEAIRRGDYKPGERLPAERELAEIHGVSYMTARRAVTEMVEVDLLRRRPREGTFVPPRSQQRLAARTVHLVCPVSGSSVIRSFTVEAAQIAEKRDWRTETIRIHPAQTRPAIRALESGDLMLILPAGPELDGPLADALEKAEGRAVIVGNRLDNRGVPSVMADDTEGIRLAMEHLHGFGHREIAVVTAHPDHNVDRVQIAAWKANSPKNWSADHFARRTILVDTPRHTERPDHVYRCVKDYLASDDGETTALICLIDEMSLPTLAACRDMGRPAPEKMSIIASGNSPMLAYSYPPMTCVDIHMAQHVQKAMNLLDNYLAGELKNEGLLQLIKPHLVVRQSVGTVTR